MYFCDKCRFMFDVTKDIKSIQNGGKINKYLLNLINKFENGDQIDENDINKISKRELLDFDGFDNLTKKKQQKIISMIKNIDPNFFTVDKNQEGGSSLNKSAYFICKFCQNSKPVKPMTLIYTKIFGLSGNPNSINYNYVKDDHALFRTRNYICKNDKCETHNNINLKEAALIKNSDDQIVYVCTVCSTNWITSI